MHHRVRRVTSLALIAVVTICASAWMTSAHAQSLGYDVPRGMIPRPIRLDGIDELAHFIELSAEQRRAIDHLHEEFVAEYRVQRRRRWQQINDLPNEAPDPVAAATLRREISAARNWSKMAYEQFLDSVMDMLTPEQRAREEAIRLRFRRARCDLSLFQIPASWTDPMVPDLFLLLFATPVSEQIPDQALEQWLAYERRAVELAERFDEWLAMRLALYLETGDAHASQTEQWMKATEGEAVPLAVACVRAIAGLLDDPVDHGMVFRAAFRIFHASAEWGRLSGYPLALDPWTASTTRRNALQDGSSDDAAPCLQAIHEANARQIDAIDGFLRKLGDAARRAASDPESPNVRAIWNAEARPFSAQLNKPWSDVQDACGRAIRVHVLGPLPLIDRREWSIQIQSRDGYAPTESWPTGGPTGSITLPWMQQLFSSYAGAGPALEEAFEEHIAAWREDPAIKATRPRELFMLRFSDETESTREDEDAQLEELHQRRRAVMAAAQQLDQRWFRTLREMPNLDGEAIELLHLIERALRAERLTRWSHRVNVGQRARLIFESPLRIVVDASLDRDHTAQALRIFGRDRPETLERAETFFSSQMEKVFDLDEQSIDIREARRTGMNPSFPRERSFRSFLFTHQTLRTKTTARRAWMKDVHESLPEPAAEKFISAVNGAWFPELDRWNRQIEQILKAVIDGDIIDPSRRDDARDLVLTYRAADAENRQSLIDIASGILERFEAAQDPTVLSAAYAEQLVHHWEIQRRTADRLREVLTEAEAKAVGLHPPPRYGRPTDIGLPREIIYPPLQ